ncbi:MAG: hypothetical protein ACT4N4_09170 [Rhodospirillales bacterium]
MAKAKPKRTKGPATKQGERFKKLARELEADGKLNLTEAGDVFESAFKKIVPVVKKAGV